MPQENAYSLAAFDPATLPRNEKGAVKLEVALRPTGDAWRLPLLYVTGAASGPTLVVTAGVHGDEYEGIFAAGELYAALQPGELHGSVLIVTVCNVAAYEAAQRSSPVDGLNLARVFPGEATGTLTQRIAHGMVQGLIRHADFYIDLHSAGVAYDIPTLVGYIKDPGEVGQASYAAAQAFGAPVMWGHPLPLAPGRTLSSATELGIPALYTEAPGGGYARAQDVECFKQGVLNVARHLGILRDEQARTQQDGGGSASAGGAPESAPGSAPIHLFGDGDLDAVLLAPAGGLFRPHVELLAEVQAGDHLGSIYDLFGQQIAKITADQAGVVLLLRRLARVYPGDGLAHVTQWAT
jgi:uncharacterized protein